MLWSLLLRGLLWSLLLRDLLWSLLLRELLWGLGSLHRWLRPGGELRRADSLSIFEVGVHRGDHNTRLDGK